MGRRGCTAGRCGNPAALRTLPRSTSSTSTPRPSALGSRTGARLHFTVAAKVFFRTIVRLPDRNLRPWDAAPTRPRHTRLRPSRFSVGSADGMCAWVQAAVSTGIPVVGTESPKVHKSCDRRSTAFAIYAGISAASRCATPRASSAPRNSATARAAATMSG